MDWPVIEEKLESLRRCLRRVELKCPADVDALVNDVDAQDILALNLTRAADLRGYRSTFSFQKRNTRRRTRWDKRSTC